MVHYNMKITLVNHDEFVAIFTFFCYEDSMINRILIAPSLLSADFSNIREALTVIADADADWIHLDVMDGAFVPNLTFGPKFVKDLKPFTQKPLDVHLMVNHPESMIDAFAEAGAQYITFHCEAAVHVHRIIERIKEHECKAGISLVPSTPVSLLTEILPFVDLVLVMTVNPGFGGQKMIPEVLGKVRELDAYRRENGYTYLISVDGGVNIQTAPAVREAGADILISGSAFFGADDPFSVAKALRGNIEV